ncbi:MAG: SDR family NAD(P)-dependent oxidoreductase [Candidatus Omnitrophota bacterium]
MAEKKKAIVIGASSGIGRELVKVLYEHGYAVGITARREEMLKELAGELSGDVFVQRMDVANSFEAIGLLEKLIEKMGGVDLVVVNAGAGFHNPDMDWVLEKNTIDINVSGFAAMANTAMRYFLKKGSGHLVGVSSVIALRGGSSAYSATKAFVSNYLEVMRHKAIKSGLPITVTEIAPGFVRTAMVEGGKLFWAASPRKAAEQIFDAIKNKRNHAYITRRWRIVAWALKIIPGRFLAKFF